MGGLKGVFVGEIICYENLEKQKNSVYLQVY